MDTSSITTIRIVHTSQLLDTNVSAMATPIVAIVTFLIWIPAVILSGGPASVYASDATRSDATAPVARELETAGVSVQTVFAHTQTRRPVDRILDEQRFEHPIERLGPVVTIDDEAGA